MSRADRFYLFVTVFLVIDAIAGGVMLAVQYSRSQPVEIVLSQTEPPELSGEIYIGGAEASPGIYSFFPGLSVSVSWWLNWSIFNSVPLP